MRPSKVLLVLLPIVVLGATPALGNGGKGKTTDYEGKVRLDEAGSVHFSTELELILFRLNSVRNKYKVVRLKVDNQSRRDLLLSPEQDQIELVFDDGASAPGILNLAARDAVLWDALPADLRQILTYPRLVEQGEEENVFVFIADPNLARLPKFFRYRISSLPRPVEIVDLSRVSAAKK